MRRRTLLFAVGGCFLLSGAAGLLYEVVWMRLLGLLFGHTVHAVTTVLAAYMGGLALGSVLLGRWADRVRRPLRAYALLEAAIALTCLATPLLFQAADAVYLSLVRALDPPLLGSIAIHFVLSALLLVVPTTLMGATLPLLSRVVVEKEGAAAAPVGTLYALNTWGAVVGTAMTGFALLPAIGLRATVVVGVALDLLVAAAALAVEARLARGGEGELRGVEPAAVPAAEPVRRDPKASRAVRLALVAIGASGAASMAYEVAWTRALSLVLGSSVYAFSVMLATFLCGLALGALAASRALRRWKLGLGAFAAVECGIGLAAVALLPAFGALPELFLRLLAVFGLRHEGALLAQVTASALVMILPTALVGSTFPLVVAAIARDPARVGRDVGAVYGANTIGTIAGSAGAGFALIPLAGIQNGVLAAAAVNLAAGLLVALGALPARRPVRLGSAGALALYVLLAVGLPRWDQKLMSSGVAIYAQQYLSSGAGSLGAQLADNELLFHEEGINTTIAVMRTGERLAFLVNGKLDGGNGVDTATQLMLGHVPAFSFLEAKRALVVGLGTGMTAGALAQHPLERIDVAELEPAISDAARFFQKENHGVLDDPKVHVVIGDGRHVLAASAAPYDIIVSEPSNPWIAGIASLFTREFYAAARDRLSAQGVFAQWLQGYNIYQREMRMVFRTFLEAFPHATVWRLGSGDYLLVGSRTETVLDLPAIRRRVAESPGTRADLDRLGLEPEDLLGLFLLSGEDARRFGEGAPVNTDDLPLLEFAAPKALYASSAAEENERLLRSFQRQRFPKVRGADVAALDSPAAVLSRARRRWLEGRFGAARAFLGDLSEGEVTTVALRAERARLLFVTGRIDDASRELDALEREKVSDASIRRWARAASAIRASGLTVPLVHELVKVSGPSYAQTYEAFAEALLRVGSQRGVRDVLPLAAEQLEAALVEDPRSQSALSSAALVYLELGRKADALRAAQRAVAIAPEDARAHVALGAAYEVSGRTGEAVRAYEAAARLAPGWASPLERLSHLRSGSSAQR